ncbi:MAG: hypothetical protein IPL69_19805 [Saprospiraceae bacterium]|nr:hypothetical protein [Candidatus Brachybacter algidus]
MWNRHRLIESVQYRHRAHQTDNLGTVLWANRYGTSNRDDAKSICLTSDGGMVIAGSTDNNANSRLDDLLILKTDSAGLLVWSKGIEVLE